MDSVAINTKSTHSAASFWEIKSSIALIKVCKLTALTGLVMKIFS